MYHEQCAKFGEEQQNTFPQFVSMEMVAVLDFMALVFLGT